MKRITPGCSILICIICATLIIFQFNIAGFIFAFLEIGIYGAGLVQIDKQKANAYLASKYDEEQKKK